MGARVAAHLLMEALIDGDDEAEIPHRVGVDRQKLDFADGAGELAGNEHRAADAQRRRFLEERRQLVALREQVRGLPQLVHGHREDRHREEDESADLQLVPGDE